MNAHWSRRKGRQMSIEILLVEDNPGDARLTKEALGEGSGAIHLHVVNDGIEAMAFLRKEGVYSNVPSPDFTHPDGSAWREARILALYPLGHRANHPDSPVPKTESRGTLGNPPELGSPGRSPTTGITISEISKSGASDRAASSARRGSVKPVASKPRRHRIRASVDTMRCSSSTR